MSVLVDTEALPELERKSFWRDAVCGPFMYSAPVYRKDEAFYGTHDACVVGDTTLMTTRSSPYGTVRGRSEVSQTPAEVAVLMRQRTGTRWFSQNGRSVTLTPQDLMLVDSASPMSGDMVDAGDLQCIVIPRPALARRIGSLETTVGRGLTGDSPAGSLLNDYIDMIARQRSVGNPVQQQWIENSFHDLIAMAFGAAPGELETGSTSLQSARIVTLTRYIDRHYANLDMTPESVAVHFGISPRYLHKLFEKSSRSFRQTLVQRRLAAVRQCLSDTEHATRSIADIAFACGFADLSGFNRAFRAEFGMTPRDMRVQILAKLGQIGSRDAPPSD